jgi:hypothetical protein
MRTRWTALAGLGLLCALAGCNSGNPNGSGPGSTSAPPSATGSGAAGAAPACVAGTWRSTSTEASASGSGVAGTVSGGQGVMLTIGADGATNIDFSSMRPIDLVATAAPGSVKGQYNYAGTVSGTLRFSAAGQSGAATSGPSPSAAPPGTTSAASATPIPDTGSATAGSTPPAAPEQTGGWQPAGDVSWNDLRLTLKVTEPISQTLLDNARISGVSSNQVSQAGDLVDLLPILRQGTYSCGGSTLTIRPDGSAAAVTWVFQRA